MLLEGAIGDAYGAGFEFADTEKIRTKNTLVQYETHPLHEEIRARYTDDTQMAIGIAELLVGGEAWTSLSVANKFVEVFKRDPRRGYAKRFYQFLSEIADGQELLAKIKPKSERNGAAMRAYPIGILPNEEDVKEKSRLQAEVTHQTEKAILAAEAIALATHYFVYRKGTQATLIEYLQDQQQTAWQGNWEGKVNINAIETVEAVITLLSRERSLKVMLKKSVEFEGDVDTVASLSLAIGKMSPEIEDDLPQWLYEDLENGAYGREYLMELDRKLMLCQSLNDG